MTTQTTTLQSSQLWRAVASFRGQMPAVWLFVRLVLGITWLRAGWGKIGDAAWTDTPRGAAVEGFLGGSIANATSGDHPEVQHWFHNLAEDILLPNAEVLGFLVAYGEFLVGAALLIGLFTRLTALFGVSMNLAFIFAGTTSSNPQMLLLGLAIALVGAGAGTYGVDRWVLPWLRVFAGQRLVRVGFATAIAGGIVLTGWLAWITTDTQTWLITLLIAGGVAAAAKMTLPRGRSASAMGERLGI